MGVDPWAMTWRRWVDAASRVVPKLIRTHQGRKLMPADLAKEEAELKASEVKEGDAAPVQ